MSERPLITRVVLENYKIIAFCDVKLGPLSILVGPNGAGKSNFLDALRFLSDAMEGPVENAFEKRSGFSRVLRRQSAGHEQVGIRIEFVTDEDTRGFYSIRLAYVDRKCVVQRERCYIGDRPGFNEFDVVRGVARAGSHPVPGVGPSHLLLPFMAGYPYFSPVLSLLNHSRFYNFSPRELRQPTIANSADSGLRSDGSNLASVLDHIRAQHPTMFGRIAEYVRAVTPSISEIDVTDISGYRMIVFVETNGSFSPNEVSDGTLRALAVLAALFQEASVDVSLVGLEEPEAALHPAASGVLFDALREASASVQVIATTHSADLLDKKDIDTESILAVEMEDGISRIGHVNNTGRQALKERLYTAGELMRMNYLTPESSPVPNESEIESLLFGDLVSA